MTWRSLRIVFCVALMPVLAGCGDRRVSVAGQVKYNGAPLAKSGGTIVFSAPNGTQVSAPIAEDGSYQTSQVVAGENRVAVYYPNPEVRKGKVFPAPDGTDETSEEKKSVPRLITPEKYAAFEQSGLSIVADQGCTYSPELTGPEIP